MSELASIAGGWSFTPDWVHKLVIYGIPGAIIGASVWACYKTESCKSKFSKLFGTDSKNGSANALTNVQVNNSAKPPNTPPTPVVTPPTPVNSTPNQKSTTQGGRQTRSRHTKHAQRNSKKTRRSRK